jgi:hypothetical protein
MMINITTITKSEAPPCEELEHLAKIYTDEYNLYRTTYKLNIGKKTFRYAKSDGTKGHYGSHFESLHKLLQQLPDIDPQIFIRAQFHFRGVIAPYQLFDDKAPAFYFSYLDQCNANSGDSISLDGLKKTLESAKDYIYQICQSWGIDQNLSSYFTHLSGNGIPKFTFEYMINEMPPKLLLANSESYRNAHKFLPKDIQHDMPSLSSLKEHTGYYIKYPDLLRAFKVLFGTGESIL